MSKFFSRLSYSIGNEDWRTEEQALNLQANDHVLCITASGDRPLNLLIRNCKKIVCIDANIFQNSLLELKVVAMQQLDYKEYLAFLGVDPKLKKVNRLQILERLLPYLSLTSAELWLANKKMIAKGILYQGAVERLTKVVSTFASLLYGKKINQLFSFDHLEDQKKFIKEQWNGVFFQKILELVLNSLLSRIIIEDPGLNNVCESINPGTYIYDRIEESLSRNIAKKNLLLSLILKGRVFPEAYSPYLTKFGTQVIKNHLDAIEIKTVDVLDYLESIQEPTFDVFSLSDVASYLSYPNFIRLIKGIIKTAKPGARFCIREFLSSHQIPNDLKPYFERNAQLEKDLEKSDNCFVYRFMVGIVNTNPSQKTTVSCKGLKKEFAGV